MPPFTVLTWPPPPPPPPWAPASPPEQPPIPAMTNAVTPAIASRLPNIVPPPRMDAQRNRSPSGPVPLAVPGPTTRQCSQRGRSAVSCVPGIHLAVI
ncbi:hypothetical protein HEK131_31060 [Streptomyces seoulensis]|nr:hypothetical protein HEK131_31060 [Streptomyces seoulensis]